MHLCPQCRELPTDNDTICDMCIEVDALSKVAPWSSDEGIVAKRGAPLKGSTDFNDKETGSHYDQGICDDKEVK